MADTVLMQMKLLLIYQLKVCEMWDSIDNPNKFKSIIGLFKEYDAVNHLLNEERHQNPSVIASLYQIERQTTRKIKNSLVLIKLNRLDNTVFLWMDACREFLSQEKFE